MKVNIGLQTSLRRRAVGVQLDSAGPQMRIVMVEVKLANIAA